MVVEPMRSPASVCSGSILFFQRLRSRHDQLVKCQGQVKPLLANKALENANSNLTKTHAKHQANTSHFIQTSNSLQIRNSSPHSPHSPPKTSPCPMSLFRLSSCSLSLTVSVKRIPKRFSSQVHFHQVGAPRWSSNWPPTARVEYVDFLKWC